MTLAAAAGPEVGAAPAYARNHPQQQQQQQQQASSAPRLSSSGTTIGTNDYVMPYTYRRVYKYVILI